MTAPLRCALAAITLCLAPVVSTAQAPAAQSGTAATAPSAAAVPAHLKLATVLADNMVLQRDQPIHSWGWADPDVSGTVRLNDRSASFHADGLGRWSVSLAPMSAGGPFEAVVHTPAATVTLHNILIGDVWVASGQSNMEFTMADALRDGPAEIRAANYPNLRLMVVDHAVSDFPNGTLPTAGWKVCTPETVRTMSAVAYFFARDVLNTERVPVGVIASSVGGTPAESWISLDSIAADASLMPLFQARALMMNKQYAVELTKAREAAENAQRVQQGLPPNPAPWRPDPAAWNPGALFNGMIAPLTPMPIRGIIWYQGESNTDAIRAPLYERTFTTLIQDWRNKWQLPDLPFLYVQIANYDSTDDWPTVRDAQRRALALRNTGMAVSIDIGEGSKIHPPDKQDVGHRLALLARNIVYGDAHVEPYGPLFSKAWTEGGTVVVQFTHAQGAAPRGPSLRGFELADDTGRYVAAEATVSGSTVRLHAAGAAHPTAVRYDWRSNPDGNLYNAAGLPASPFGASLNR